MANEQAIALVFKDQAGEYYLLPQHALERGRVPEQHKAEVEALLSHGDADVSGYVVNTAYTLLRVVNAAATAAGDATERGAVQMLLWDRIYKPQ